MMSFPSESLPCTLSAWDEASASPPGSDFLAAYIHIPFCRSRCLFCPFYYGSASDLEKEEYVNALLKEIELYKASPLSDRIVNAVYFGGGSPGDLKPSQIIKLVKSLRSSLRLSNDCEITLESRLSSISDDLISAASDCGINRVSLGVQTFDTALRRSLGRSSDKTAVISALQRLLKVNQFAVVIDLLYGLPGQTMELWKEDIRIVLEELRIAGLDMYELGVHGEMPLMNAIEAGKLPSLPDKNLRYEMYKAGEDIMEQNGAVRLSIKHFSFNCRERNMYNEISNCKSDCIPFGMRAGGRLGNFAFRQVPDMKSYLDAVYAGKKPLAYAGRNPADFRFAALLAGQISRRRLIDIDEALRLAEVPCPDKIREAVKPLVAEWLENSWLLPSGNSSYRLSPYALFDHKRLAPLLFEAAASAYN